MSSGSAPVIICPIRYDNGTRAEDRQLWMELRELLSNSHVRALAFVAVVGHAHWADRFNPVPAAARSSRR